MSVNGYHSDLHFTSILHLCMVTGAAGTGDAGSQAQGVGGPVKNAGPNLQAFLALFTMGKLPLSTIGLQPVLRLLENLLAIGK